MAFRSASSTHRRGTETEGEEDEGEGLLILAAGGAVVLEEEEVSFFCIHIYIAIVVSFATSYNAI